MPRAGVAAREHRTHELEHHQVERGLEVVREMRLDERGADRAQIVGEPDADARLLAGLGTGVDRRGDGRGDRGTVHTAGVGRGVVAGVRILTVRVGAALLRHVLRLHQALDDLERAVAPDGGDAPRHGEVLGAERRAGLDLGLDRVEARLDAFGLLDQLVRPLVLVHGGELVVAGAELLDLGVLGVRRLARLGLDAPEARGGAPVHLGHGVRPLPAGRELVGRGGELGHGELAQQLWILEPHPVLVLVGEEVAQHGAARGLVGLDADEAGHGGARRHPLLGQHALHLPGRRPVALGRDPLPHGPLPVVVGGDGERHQRLEVDGLGAVGVEQLGRRVAEAKPLLDGTLGDSEARGDGRDGDAGRGETCERDHLVGGVHRDAHDVLRERELAGVAVRGDLAGNGVIGVERAVLGERLQRGEAASAGDDGEALDAVRVRLVGAGDEVLEQPVRLDGRRSCSSANSSGGVLRTFSGASASRQSGISRMSGSGAGAVWFIRVSMDERIDGANAAFSGRHAPARAGLGSASGCCSCVARVPAAGRPAPAPEGSCGEGPETGAAARRAVSGGGSARSAASSRRPAASRSAAAASRMARALTKGSGGRSVSAVHDTHDASRARAWSASESAWAGAP